MNDRGAREGSLDDEKDKQQGKPPETGKCECKVAQVGAEGSEGAWNRERGDSYLSEGLSACPRLNSAGLGQNPGGRLAGNYRSSTRAEGSLGT